MSRMNRSISFAIMATLKTQPQYPICPYYQQQSLYYRIMSLQSTPIKTKNTALPRTPRLHQKPQAIMVGHEPTRSIPIATTRKEKLAHGRPRGVVGRVVV